MESKIVLIYPRKFPNGVVISNKSMTVLELHRKLQSLLDNASGYPLDITDPNVSERINDVSIRINKPYYLSNESFNLLTDGSIVQYRNSEREMWVSGIGWKFI